jgi:Protein of unknown function (DUF3224)
MILTLPSVPLRTTIETGLGRETHRQVAVSSAAMSEVAHGTFEIALTPGEGELDGRIGRNDFTKTFTGDLVATGHGVMLTGGDPPAGTAGYVAIETVDGRLHESDGSFALQQFGTMAQGETSLQYAIVPGSGSGALQGISGTLELTVETDGTHHYALTYEL